MTNPPRPRRPRILAATLLAVLAAGGPVLAGAAEPAPPYPAYPSPRTTAPPPRVYYPPPPVVAPPPPLSPAVRVIYAPFYAAGLVIRYGVYYAIVAPLEVFARTVTYGAQGGVERPARPPAEESR